MIAKENLMYNLPRFSSDGEKVYKELCSVQSGDSRVELFARRLARAITAHDAGAYGRSGPLERCLLCGTIFSNIHLLVHTAAKAWIGDPWDGGLPYTYIDCEAFHTPYPGMLSSLVGGVGQESEIRKVPVLGQVEWPHFNSRRSKDLKLLQEWNEWFLKTIRPRIEQMDFRAASMFYSELRILVSDAWRKLYEEEKRANGEFGSLIFFDRIDRASMPIYELMMAIMNNGSLALATGSRVDFKHSVVIASVCLEKNTYGENIGFASVADENTPKENVFEREYTVARRKIFKGIGATDLVQKFGGNLFLIGERTNGSQLMRVKSELDKITGAYKEKNIYLEFSEDFINGFVKDTSEVVSERTVFTEERISNGINQHIFDPINRLILAGKLKKGAILNFDSQKENEFEPGVFFKDEGGEERIKPEDMREKSSEEFERLLKSKDLPEWILELNEKTKEIMSKARMR